jgi:hypothetical protein
MSYSPYNRLPSEHEIAEQRRRTSRIARAKSKRQINDARRMPCKVFKPLAEDGGLVCTEMWAQTREDLEAAMGADTNPTVGYAEAVEEAQQQLEAV